MPTTESAKKRLRQAEGRRLRNRIYSSRARTFVKRTDKLIAEGKLEEAAQAAHLASNALDKAAQKGVLHQRNAARSKSRLMKRLHSAQAEPKS